MGKFKLWEGKFIPFFEREHWGAVDPKFTQFDCTELPLSHVRYSYDDMMVKYNTTETSVALQETQKEHIAQGLEDIKYNFIINPEGIIYEGRGWYSMPAMEPKYTPLKFKIIDICFIGDFSEKDPPWPMMRTALQIVMKGLRALLLNSNFRLIGLREPPDRKLEFI